VLASWLGFGRQAEMSVNLDAVLAIAALACHALTSSKLGVIVFTGS
jgi:hypothetical protein